ncbi:MAG: hypothetical protein ABWY18_05025 [Tardiphaga sp.]
MSRASKLATSAVVAILLSSAGAFAQSGGGAGGGASGGATGTNSAGTANASGGRTGSGITTGATGTGQSVDGKPTTGDSQVDAQDRAVDRKVKSICKGC